MVNETKIDQLFEQKQQQFLLRLKDILNKCEQWKTSLQNHSLSLDDRKEMQLCFHSLAGTAQMLSFPEITQIAQKIDYHFLEMLREQKEPTPTDDDTMAQDIEEFHIITANIITTHQTDTPMQAVTIPSSNEYNHYIILADDDPVLRDMMQQSLESEGCGILPAVNGKEVLELVHQMNVNLIVLDVHMPEMDGFETLRQLKSNTATANIPVLLISRYDKEEYYGRAVKLGAINYLVKPLRFAQMVEAIMEITIRTTKRILVVDDDRIARTVLTEHLRQKGYGLFEAVDGEQCLAMMQSHYPHLVILDRLMPGLDGIEVIKCIREKNSFVHTPVLMLSSKDGKQDIQEALDCGITEYFTKPFKVEQIAKRIDEILSDSKLEHRNKATG